MLLLTGSISKKEEILIELEKLNELYNLKLNLNLWEDFTNQMRPANSGQLEMFA